MTVSLPTRIRTCLGTVALVTASLFWAEPSSANASVVEVLPCQASSQGARITIDLSGKSTKDVKVVVTTPENHFIQAVSMDETGLVVLPRLAPGKYLVTASAPDNQGGSICVEISKRKWKQVSSFSLTLKALPPDSLTLEQMLAAAENSTPSEHIQEFKGEVVDPSGAMVPGTSIQIFSRGVRVRDDARTVKMTTDVNGHFSVTLADGIYTALFVMPGFQIKIVTFEITHTGVVGGLRISLQIGMST